MVEKMQGSLTQLVTVALVYCVLYSASPVSTQTNTDNSSKNTMYGPCVLGPCTAASSTADIILGGLFPVHVFGSSGCPRRVEPENIQWVEAMRHAVELVNDNTALLPGITLGYEIRDSCRRPSHALRQCLQFIARSRCGTVNTNKTLAGVVGSFSSSVSFRATELLGLFQIPMVSYGSTSARLSNKADFKYFLRTIPSDQLAAEAIAKLIRSQGWQFVAIVYTSDTFGADGANSVLAALNITGTCKIESDSKITPVCTSLVRAIPEGKTPSDSTVYAGIWDSLLFTDVTNMSTVVVMFTQETETKHFFELGEKNDTYMEAALSKNITFLGVDAWGDIPSAVNEAVQISRGSVSAIPEAKQFDLFREHWTNLNPANNKNNPWFKHFWETEFECTTGSPDCETGNSLGMNYSMSSKVPYVYMAVDAYAHALQQLYSACQWNRQCLFKRSSDGEQVLSALRQVDFSTIHGTPFYFDGNGDPGISRYDIKNMQVSSSQPISFDVVGTYEGIDGIYSENGSCVRGHFANASGLQRTNCSTDAYSLNSSAVIWNSESLTLPVSVCSATCRPGFWRQLIQTESDSPENCRSCCWKCMSCSANQFSILNNSNTCAACLNSKTSVSGSDVCEAVPIVHYHTPSTFSIVIIIVAILGLAFTLIGTAWCIMNVHSSFFIFGREPTFACLLGLLLAYISALIESDGPSGSVCFARTILAVVGMSLPAAFALVYVVHRLTIATKSMFSAFFLQSLNRLVAMLVLVVITVTIVIANCSGATCNAAKQNYVNHVKVELRCGFSTVDIACAIYLCLLNVLSVALSVYMTVLLTTGKVEPVVYDTKSRLFSMIAVSAGLSAVLTAALLAVQSADLGPDTEDAVLQLQTVQFASAFVIVLLQPLRRLHYFSIDEEEEYMKRLEFATRRESRAFSFSPPRSKEKSSAGKLDSKPDMLRSIVITEEPERRGSIGSYKEALDTPVMPNDTIQLNKEKFLTTSEAVRLDVDGVNGVALQFQAAESSSSGEAAPGGVLSSTRATSSEQDDHREQKAIETEM